MSNDPIHYDENDPIADDTPRRDYGWKGTRTVNERGTFTLGCTEGNIPFKHEHLVPSQWFEHPV